MGDGNLWLCALYLDYTSKKRKSSLGMEAYARTGMTAYDFAVSIGNELKGFDVDVRLPSRLGDNFKYIVTCIFDMTRRIGMAPPSPEVIREFSETYY